MKIGIIGAGQIGGTLTRLLTKLGYEVFVANSRGPASLADLARETGAQAVSVREAARAGEVVVVTIPEAKIRDLPRDMFAGVPDEVVVIDTGNYYPRERDGRIGDIEAGMAESRWVANQLGFDAVDAGGLDESWRQQPGTPVYTTDLDAEGVRRALAQASNKRTPKRQATENSPGTFANPA